MVKQAIQATPETITHVGVGVCRMDRDPYNTHAGVFYRELDGTISLLHLGWQYKLYNDTVFPLYKCVEPNLDPDRARAIAARCRTIWKNRPKIPYSFRLDESARFNSLTGNLEAMRTGNGLNCSNFIIVLFLTAGVSLVEFSTWQERTEDAVWHKRLHDLLKVTRSASLTHIEAVEKEIGCPRVRPEEVAGACVEPRLPANFLQCKTNAKIILKIIDKQQK